MRFSLCCLFWLAIVYGSIVSGQGAWPELPRTPAAAGPKGLAAAETAVTLGAAEACRRRPADCLAVAERLGALLADRASARPGERVPAGMRRLARPQTTRAGPSGML